MKKKVRQLLKFFIIGTPAIGTVFSMMPTELAHQNKSTWDPELFLQNEVTGLYANSSALQKNLYIDIDQYQTEAQKETAICNLIANGVATLARNMHFDLELNTDPSTIKASIVGSLPSDGLNTVNVSLQFALAGGGGYVSAPSINAYTIHFVNRAYDAWSIITAWSNYINLNPPTIDFNYTSDVVGCLIANIKQEIVDEMNREFSSLSAEFNFDTNSVLVTLPQGITDPTKGNLFIGLNVSVQLAAPDGTLVGSPTTEYKEFNIANYPVWYPSPMDTPTDAFAGEQKNVVDKFVNSIQNNPVNIDMSNDASKYADGLQAKFMYQFGLAMGKWMLADGDDSSFQTNPFQIETDFNFSDLPAVDTNNVSLNVSIELMLFDGSWVTPGVSETIKVNLFNMPTPDNSSTTPATSSDYSKEMQNYEMLMFTNQSEFQLVEQTVPSFDVAIHNAMSNASSESFQQLVNSFTYEFVTQLAQDKSMYFNLDKSVLNSFDYRNGGNGEQEWDNWSQEQTGSRQLYFSNNGIGREIYQLETTQEMMDLFALASLDLQYALVYQAGTYNDDIDNFRYNLYDIEVNDSQSNQHNFGEITSSDNVDGLNIDQLPDLDKQETFTQGNISDTIASTANWDSEVNAKWLPNIVKNYTTSPVINISEDTNGWTAGSESNWSLASGNPFCNDYEAETSNSQIIYSVYDSSWVIPSGYTIHGSANIAMYPEWPKNSANRYGATQFQYGTESNSFYY